MKACGDHRKRSVVKCISWRTIAFLDTAVLSLVFTGSLTSAVAIGGSEIATKSFLYYFHERVWVWIACTVQRWRGVAAFADTKLYAGLKTISWRTLGSIDTFIIALVVTGDLAASSSIGLAEILTKTLLYYAHERLWLRLSWGKATPPPALILPPRPVRIGQKPVVQT